MPNMTIFVTGKSSTVHVFGGTFEGEWALGLMGTTIFLARGDLNIVKEAQPSTQL